MHLLIVYPIMNHPCMVLNSLNTYYYVSCVFDFRKPTFPTKS